MTVSFAQTTTSPNRAIWQKQEARSKSCSGRNDVKPAEVEIGVPGDRSHREARSDLHDDGTGMLLDDARGDLGCAMERSWGVVSGRSRSIRWSGDVFWICLVPANDDFHVGYTDELIVD